jgi:hypothetical protein
MIYKSNHFLLLWKSPFKNKCVSKHIFKLKICFNTLENSKDQQIYLKSWSTKRSQCVNLVWFLVVVLLLLWMKYLEFAWATITYKSTIKK